MSCPDLTQGSTCGKSKPQDKTPSLHSNDAKWESSTGQTKRQAPHSHLDPSSGICNTLQAPSHTVLTRATNLPYHFPSNKMCVTAYEGVIGGPGKQCDQGQNWTAPIQEPTTLAVPTFVGAVLPKSICTFTTEQHPSTNGSIFQKRHIDWLIGRAREGVMCNAVLLTPSFLSFLYHCCNL